MFVETLKESSDAKVSFRKQAQEKVLQAGFPTRKNESFKYVDLKSLEESAFTVNGDGYELTVSSDRVEVLTLEKALEKYGVFIANDSEKMTNDENSFFSLVNRGWSETTHCIFVSESIDEVIEITQRCEGNNQMFLPRLQFYVLAGAQASFHHKFELRGQKNVVCKQVDVMLEKDSTLKFYETSDMDFDNEVFFQTKGNIKKDAEFYHKSGTKGCKNFRNEIRTYLLEERAMCSLEGFWNGEESENIHHLAHCSHLAEDTKSRQHYQGVAGGKVRASFEGQIYVDSVAQKTDSYQLSKHLLIGEKARGFSKPNLEVFADDVIASHGATISMLNDDELFYLVSRGISKNDAATLLKRGFLSFFVDDMEESKVKEAFERLI
jgi:Fe-S cluster assembly protein SufD